MCTDILNKLKFNRIVYGCKNSRFGGCVDSCIQIQHCYTTTGNIYNNECIELLKLFYERGNPNAPDYKRTRPLMNQVQQVEQIIKFDNKVK